MLKLFNSLTRKIEEFKPITDKAVGLYTCGPTVYNYAHVGNLRTYLFEDFLRRALEYNGYTVKHVMNITDVGHLTGDQDFGEDKMEKEGGSVEEILNLAKKYTDAFLADLKTLNILQAETLAPATEYIPQQIKLIEKLFQKEIAYETELAIYFDVSKFENYGQLTGQKMEDKKVGARSDVVVDKNKKHPADFALWFKLAGKYKNHLLRWDSPWGQGFPGWHIECSAISEHFLGQPFDIHTGGIDHLFPHHTNEIAQSEGANDKPLANYWLHGEHLLIREGRMGKSEGNILTLSALVDKGFNPLAYRYLVLTSHYRSKLNFTEESLTGAQHALNNLYQEISNYDEPKVGCAQFEEDFLNAVNNDLDTPKALAIMWDLIKTDEFPTSAKAQTLFKFDEILGLKMKAVWEAAKVIPDVVHKLIDEREVARKSKDFVRSDELRRAIESNGYIVEDTLDGFRVKKKFDKN
ncbi:MAG: cysteine--tRNA ligase [Candidatus Doudnabacteria bacterium RIFCSPHIGHO2_02_FULL_42_25]|uniref:Cysteine--tRNA ligase n=1 Tax=Candidatus Doudnabacteria bacterium RIFCSPHIGHO2_01_FULL_41_86 TaxID=1817821 RepID=A0A1F5N906_9BACT|nr:MAG: cysteine--tRNA ligase [Candidatus Doudnabacteria bacterium RIFCSPHIGHO2_01_FULL_41_86]OGE74850.1 MAG: cysteine--tRNA ligase [Candidatus Doudnabacteria bacterium RIFCSPHIGHO2_01_43_10]OGE85194.1 MAG: cysteine--tRNA ligase [Candidatus Doudnabacteria bacterium RIFCSPHIGHO2_12_FULL_42_22]OGE86732.1 MAG: cysteine--tRNA ligase [Candidatus Doudnabacteria bacterium RIFCSPHIGHO2_02_FULL_42_25]OGE92330.1 MAG: cysteine--tRNA ligase [Candidatus Doudnabacteria bacterium RIFCSPLOWO2_01_FULL_42_60]OG